MPSVAVDLQFTCVARRSAHAYLSSSDRGQVLDKATDKSGCTHCKRCRAQALRQRPADACQRVCRSMRTEPTTCNKWSKSMLVAFFVLTPRGNAQFIMACVTRLSWCASSLANSGSSHAQHAIVTQRRTQVSTPLTCPGAKPTSFFAHDETVHAQHAHGHGFGTANNAMHVKHDSRRHLPARAPNPQLNLTCQASKVFHMHSCAGAGANHQLHGGQAFSSNYNKLQQQAGVESTRKKPHTITRFSTAKCSGCKLYAICDELLVEPVLCLCVPSWALCQPRFSHFYCKINYVMCLTRIF